MASKRLKSIKGRVIRLTRLDECGAPDTTSPCGVIVTSGFVSVTIGNEVESGEEYTQKNAWGDFCISEKDGDRIKWANVTIEMCEVDPEVLDLVGGAHPVVSAADTIGATFGTEPNPNAFAAEVWTKKAGTDACAGGAGAPEWGYFVVPYIRNGKLDGDITIENGPMTISLAGEGVGANAAWGLGPHGDAPMVVAFPEGDLYGMVITTVQPPAVTDGCQLIDATPLATTATPGATLPAHPEVSASDAPNAAKLTELGYSADPSTPWVAGEQATVGTFAFYWDGTAWQPGTSTLVADPQQQQPAQEQQQSDDVE